MSTSRSKASQAASKQKQQRGLSARQEKFATIYASGTSATEAYLQAYGPSKGARVSASKLLTSPNIAARVAQIQSLAAQGAVLTLQDKRMILRKIVLAKPDDARGDCDLCERKMGRDGAYHVFPDKLRAIQMDAKLAGELREKHEHELSSDDGLGELLAQISLGK